MSTLRAWIDWWLRDRKTNRIVVAQFPNATLGVWMIASALRRIFADVTGAEALHWIAVGALLAWGVDEAGGEAVGPGVETGGVRTMSRRGAASGPTSGDEEVLRASVAPRGQTPTPSPLREEDRKACDESRTVPGGVQGARDSE